VLTHQKSRFAGVLISCVIVNIPNGLWEESTGTVMMAFAACCVVLCKEVSGGRVAADILTRVKDEGH